MRTSRNDGASLRPQSRLHPPTVITNTVVSCRLRSLRMRVEQLSKLHGVFQPALSPKHNFQAGQVVCCAESTQSSDAVLWGPGGLKSKVYRAQNL